MIFSHKAIEKKWQKYWKENNTYKTTNDSSKKSYILDMFPYPSGFGLHVGHVKGYTATDIYARYKKMNGFDVLHPIGWDAFGLPAEQFALKTGNDPREFTLKNIENFKVQLKKLGFSYDYEKEINTANPNYYKTTQWIFKKLCEQNLAEKKEVEVNWCQGLGTTLANDEIIEKNGIMVSERGEFPVIKKKMEQWVLKITKYADRLLEGLNDLNWPSSVKELQKNWIGKSTGYKINFKSNNIDIPVFTTRADTIFGATYIVLAPENDLVLKLADKNKINEVKEYIKTTLSKSEIERKNDSQEKNGLFIGSYATNPITNKEIPIWISDYVLNDYGTGAIMAVPAHDKRDFKFAQKYNLPIIFVLKSKKEDEAFVGESEHINSDFLNGLNRIEAIEKIGEYIEKNNLGTKETNYKLRDWLFSRQRFYGEPFPVIYSKNNEMILLDDSLLPVTLPKVEYIKSSGDGKSPLSNVKEWVNLNIDGVEYTRETNTMPQSAGSSWYFLAYILTQSPNNLIDINSDKAKELFEKWLPVDLYIGGQEHAVGHLLYARFWMHVLYDLKIVPIKEPFYRLFNQGMILGSDGRKMSKSWNNVVNPDDVIESHGADALRLYEMFMGPLDASLAWNFDGLDASLKWIDRVYRLIDSNKFSNTKLNNELDYIYNKTVETITSMIESLKFNTAISKLMVLLNEFYKYSKNNLIYIEYIKGFIKMLSLFTPHICEEIWNKLTNSNNSIYNEEWPVYDKEKLIINTVKIVVQVNGKVRAVFEVEKDLHESELLNLVKNNDNVNKFISNKIIKKQIIVKNKIVSFFVE